MLQVLLQANYSRAFLIRLAQSGRHASQAANTPFCRHSRFLNLSHFPITSQALRRVERSFCFCLVLLWLLSFFFCDCLVVFQDLRCSSLPPFLTEGEWGKSAGLRARANQHLPLPASPPNCPRFHQAVSLVINLKPSISHTTQQLNHTQRHDNTAVLSDHHTSRPRPHRVLLFELANSSQPFPCFRSFTPVRRRMHPSSFSLSIPLVNDQASLDDLDSSPAAPCP